MIVIPLGRAVEEVIERLIEMQIIDEKQVLRGFPHPSGANVNRLVQLEENKEVMIKFLKDKFNI